MNANKADKEEGRRGALKALSLAGIEATNLQDGTLERLAEKHELAGLVLAYRQKRRLIGKYKRWAPEFYENGRVYPQCQMAATVTGRTTYKSPNLQGMDKRKNPEYRRCVRAPESNVIVKGDWSQQEVRIAAYFSKDPDMIRALSDPDRDVYMVVAEKLLGRPVEKGSEERQNAKRIVLGFLYGLGIERYIQNTHQDYPELGMLSKEQARREREAFREAFPAFYRWQKAFGSREGYTEEDFETRSVLGRRRVVAPDASGKPKYTDRLNGPIQTTGADVLYRTLRRLMKDQDEGVCTEATFLFSSHDEIVFECPEIAKEAVMEWLVRRMREVFGELIGEVLAGPASVEVECGQSWAEEE
jgi:DNA polymerase-1